MEGTMSYEELHMIDLISEELDEVIRDFKKEDFLEACESSDSN